MNHLSTGGEEEYKFGLLRCSRREEISTRPLGRMVIWAAKTDGTFDHYSGPQVRLAPVGERGKSQATLLPGGFLPRILPRVFTRSTFWPPHSNKRVILITSAEAIVGEDITITGVSDCNDPKLFHIKAWGNLHGDDPFRNRVARDLSVSPLCSGRARALTKWSYVPSILAAYRESSRKAGSSSFLPLGCGGGIRKSKGRAPRPFAFSASLSSRRSQLPTAATLQQVVHMDKDNDAIFAEHIEIPEASKGGSLLFETCEEDNTRNSVDCSIIARPAGNDVSSRSLRCRGSTDRRSRENIKSPSGDEYTHAPTGIRFRRVCGEHA